MASKIAAAVILLFFVIFLYIYYKNNLESRVLSRLLWLLVFSSIVIVSIKALALSGSEVVSYRVSNTFEHINLMLALGICSYGISSPYIKGKVVLNFFCIFFSFTISVLLEIAQYVYREYLGVVTGKSHGLYYDSMMDLGVNFVSACIICFLIVYIFEKMKKV